MASRQTRGVEGGQLMEEVRYTASWCFRSETVTFYQTTQDIGAESPGYKEESQISLTITNSSAKEKVNERVERLL